MSLYLIFEEKYIIIKLKNYSILQLKHRNSNE